MDEKNKRKHDFEDEIEVVPKKRQRLILDDSASDAPAFQKHAGKVHHKEKQKSVFPFGNYNRYYALRYKEVKKDVRIPIIAENAKFSFEGKDALDIGSNIGLMTLQMAEHFKLKSIRGIEIDPTLVRKAEKIIEEVAQSELPLEQEINVQVTTKNHKQEREFVQLHNETVAPSTKEQSAYDFPKNVTIERGNIIETELGDAQFDVIFCLSVTKWVHLNHGDEGIKKLFQLVFNHLRPGGLLVLEPQDWKSYKKQKTLTKKIAQIFPTISFRPKDFKEYLLKEIGFASTEVSFIQVEDSDDEENANSKKKKKGFEKRPICFYHKSEATQMKE